MPTDLRIAQRLCPARSGDPTAESPPGSRERRRRPHSGSGGQAGRCGSLRLRRAILPKGQGFGGDLALGGWCGGVAGAAPPARRHRRFARNLGGRAPTARTGDRLGIRAHPPRTRAKAEACRHTEGTAPALAPALGRTRSRGFGRRFCRALRFVTCRNGSGSNRRRDPPSLPPSLVRPLTAAPAAVDRRPPDRPRPERAAAPGAQPHRRFVAHPPTVARRQKRRPNPPDRARPGPPRTSSVRPVRHRLHVHRITHRQRRTLTNFQSQHTLASRSDGPSPLAQRDRSKLLHSQSRKGRRSRTHLLLFRCSPLPSTPLRIAHTSCHSRGVHKAHTVFRGGEPRCGTA